MKKKFIIILIGIIGLVLTGIIVVQLLWIRNAVNVRKEQFAQNVNRVMHRVVKRFEIRSKLLLVSRGDSHPGVFSLYPQPKKPGASSQGNSGGQIDTLFSRKKAGNISQQQGLINIQFDMYMKNRDTSINKEFRLNNTDSDGKQSITLNSQTGRGTFRLNINTDSNRDISNTAAQRSQQRIARMRKALDQMADEIRFSKIPIKKRLKKANLKEIIEMELKYHNITQDYEFAIAGRDSLLDYRSENFTKAAIKEAHSLNLFPNAIFRKNYHLLLHFPNQQKHILGTLSWLLIGSGFFTLAIIITFGITLMVILRQKKISRIKTDFINNMTHEFKTPIATIGLAADTISNPKVMQNTEKIQYFISKIKEENKRMNNHVEHVLQMSVMDKKDFSINPVNKNVHELIEQAIDSIGLKVKQKNGEIYKSFNAREPYAEVDEMHFTNIIYNLLDNAFKYTEKNPRIEITTENGSRGLYLSVKDNGKGMSADMKNRIFDRFYRAHTGNIHDVKGFGIGLSYVYSIVTAHKGKISVKSEKNRGSTFHIFIPYKQAH